MKAVSAALVAITLLGAFSPPQSKRESIQQAQPKSWIPEQKPDPEPPAALGDPPFTARPRQPSAYRHSEGVGCTSAPTGPAKSTRKFVESYAQAMAALNAKSYENAVTLAEIAAGHTRGDREWAAIEGIRITAFTALQNDAELVAALEAALSMTGCLRPAQAASYREMLDTVRQRLASPSRQ